MATNLESKIGRIQANVTNALSAISGKGVTVPPGANSDDLEELIENISQAEDLSAELAAQDALISELEAAVANKAAGIVEPPNIQPLTVTENGTYTASGDVDGYSPIVVEVSSTGGGIDKTAEADIIAGVYAKNTFVGSYRNNEVTEVGYGIFRGATQLTAVYFPNATNIEDYAFNNCSGLTQVDFSSVKTIGTYAFNGSGAPIMSFPVVTSVGSYSFGNSSKTTTLILGALKTVPQNMARQSSGLAKVDLGACTSISTYSFYNDSNLETLIIRTSSVCSLAGTNAFTSTKISGKKGYIYVPADLVDDYKAATNWSTYASQFRAIEDYPDICG